MAKAYTKYIGKNSADSHQISPHWLLTFLRFDNRDTLNYESKGRSLVSKPNQRPKGRKNDNKTRGPLVIENDCISVSVSTSKTNNTPNATMTLLAGDLNYTTAISPGDFVIVNMVNSTQKARELRDRAVQEKPINRIGDGFKGIFKINNINEILQTNPATGQKVLRVQITAYAFTEWNNVIYYNPTLGNSIDKDVLTYAINPELLKILNSKKNIQEVLETLPNIILGNGTVNATGKRVLATKKEPFIVPKSVFRLLNLESKVYKAIDLYRLMIGKWGNKISGTNEQEGFNPDYKEDNGVQRVNGGTLDGRIPIQTSNLTNVRLVDLMKRFSNELVNEMYFCFRVDADENRVIPKVIMRQKPFNTEHGGVDGTRYLTLPRWKISADLIYSLNISKNESLRFNFVQVIGTTGKQQIDDANIAQGNANQNNVFYDDIDIQRHGLRPYTQVSNFDWPDKGQNTKAPYWASLTWDWVYGGHLRTNGKISCVGIEEDICIGDNLELQNTVYHIESISHIGSISPEGVKTFRTNITLTHGMDKRSDARGPVYPQMEFTDTKTYREDDYNSGYEMLPGFSDTQDIRGRAQGEEVKETREKSYTPPNIRPKKTRENKDEN